MDENIFDNQNEKINLDIKESNNLTNNLIFDHSYQDYILDFGNDIYIHEQSESDEKIS